MTEQIPKRSALAQRMTNAIDETRKLAAAHNRSDLADRLALSQKRIDDPSLYVLVVGEFKQGKSSLVNALVGREVCPVDDDIATAVPTALRFGPDATAAVLYHPPEPDDPEAPPADPIREPVAIDTVARFVTEAVTPPGDRRVHSVELTLPAPSLEDGMVLVDTPGVGGLGSVHSTVTMGALPMAEALLFVSDASQEFTQPEIDFMESARSLCPNIVVLLTKIDFYPAWRKIRDIDAAHLKKLGIDAEIIAVSSTLHTVARDADDAELDAESGFPALREHLTSRIVGRAEELTASTLGTDLNGVLDQILFTLQTRKQALLNPEEAEAKRAEFQVAKERADELKNRAARWQQTLSDGTADLNAEVDHDMRARFRKINQTVDETLEDVDPADVWDEFEPWLYQRVAEDVVNNYRFLQVQGRELADTVADHFEIDAADLRSINLEVSDPTAGLARAGVDADIEVKKMGAGQSVMTGLRGGYIGMLMFGMLGSMVGLALGPLPIGIGLLMGRKQLKDEKGRQLSQRRAQARNAQRKYMDEAQFLANKDARAAARRTQRELRDFFTARAKEQSRSVDEQLAALNSAVKADQNAAKEQLGKVDVDLKALTKVRNRVQMISPQAKTS
jgi:GTPase SAR1 family protein